MTRLDAWRARCVGNERFRHLAARFPISKIIARRQAARLFSLTSGFVQSQVLFAGVETGLLDLLSHGPATANDLARRTGIAPHSLSRWLRAASALGLIRDNDDGYLTLGDLGAVVAADPGIKAMIRHHAMLYRDLADPTTLLRNGGETETRSFWAYAGTGRDPVEGEDAAAYSDLMGESQAMLASEVLNAYDFGKHRSLMDVGGGDGSFLILAGKKHSSLRLRLFDLPPVAERALDNFARQDMIDRASAFGGDFFSDSPPDDSDCVTLLRVVCDHDDDNASRLLANLHGSMQPGATLVIAEAMAGRDQGSRLATAYFSFYFLAMGAGRCRSPREITGLVHKAGFGHVRVRKTDNPMIATLLTAQA